MALTRNLTELKKQFNRYKMICQITELPDNYFAIYCRHDECKTVRKICDIIGYSVIERHEYIYSYKVDMGNCIIIY
jgi:hypothetical protein